ncbi:MAG: SRPBCC family protein [Polyangiales bacterium]
MSIVDRRAALLLLVTVTLAAPSARAGTPYAPPATDPLAVELHKLGKDKKTHFVEAVTKKTWGRGQIFVDAPMKEVRAAVLDYGSWSTTIDRFEKSKVLKREANGTTDVYLRMPILKGAATIWVVERFEPPVAEGKGEKVVGKMVSGNVDDLQAVWHYRPVDATHTLLTLEILVVPKMAVPAALLNEQLENAAGEGCLGLRERAQKTAKAAATKKP